MENFKSDRWIITSIGASPGFQLPIRFKFTKDETKDLEKILRRFDKDKVRSFLSRISLFPAIPLLEVFKTRTFPKNAIEGHLKSLKQCRKTLEKILKGFDPDPQKNFDVFRDERVRQTILRGETAGIICFNAAEKAYPHINIIEKTLTEILSNMKRSPGRIRADQEGFVSLVASLYELLFHEKPARSKGTIFYKLIAKLFDILDPKPKGFFHEPSGAIQRALKKI